MCGDPECGLQIGMTQLSLLNKGCGQKPSAVNCSFLSDSSGSRSAHFGPAGNRGAWLRQTRIQAELPVFYLVSRMLRPSESRTM